MAYNRIRIAICNYPLIAPLEKSLKKAGFSPNQFEIVAPKMDRYGSEKIVEMEQRIATAKKENRFPFILPEKFKTDEVLALLALRDEQTHCAVAANCDYSTTYLGKGVQSHFEARSVLIEAIGHRSWDTTVCNLHPFVSEFVMPFLDRRGSSEEQRTRAYANVMYGVIEGWAYQSRRYDGAVRRLRGA